MDPSFTDVIDELKERAPALGAWSYIALWSFADMAKRIKEHPNNPHFSEILFPHSNIPLFTEEQALNLENAWKSSPLFNIFKSDKNIQTGGSSEPGIFEMVDMHTNRVQTGGNGFLGVKTAAAKVGSVIGSAVGSVNPDIFSPDSHFKTFWSVMDSMDAEITNFSKQYGLMALESVAPDPKFIIPLGPFPLPVMIPIKLILPFINTVLEAFRVLGPKLPIIGSYTQTPLSILLTLLDLARGNFYHSIFSFIGIFGRYPMFAGMALKIARDAFLLISPNIRSELRTAIYKSSKSFIVGFFFWLFTMVSPEIIRRPIVKLLDTIRALIESFNAKSEQLSEKATQALRGAAQVQFPQLPSEQIPSFSDLYLIQQYIQIPQVYCHPEVDAIIQSMRSIPPLALFFDLMNIPHKTSTEWQEACSEVESKPLAEFLKPVIIPSPAQINM